MKILIADDEKMMRTGMQKEVSKVFAPKVPQFFLASDGKEAVEIFESEPDIALVFLDVEMPRLNGLEVAKRIKEISADVDIIMTTAYSEYAMDAWRLHIGGYLLKPVDAQDIKAELDHLKITPEDSKDDNGIKITCFGEFQIEADGVPLHFSRTKSKEMVAYLVAKNSATATRAQISEVLWEGKGGKSKNSYMSALVLDIKNTLREVGWEEIFYHSHNEYRLLSDKVSCDYHEFLKGNPLAIRKYRGEFMSQYSWAEEYIWDLESMKRTDH
ncbi:response regulator [Eubacterium oxidoreducens]|uniref:Stage 0 sporulation protein A homolog n=1 Tax=Eubacterium oxidoreducens TaxID=1732 RepID=A0A1G6AG73_EUBOX|nr:response regulator [Eubacterium oxidoreducens]SDB07374.1 Response regulator receiver domain-containing protein [Eubacterium oxidoreducens]